MKTKPRMTPSRPDASARSVSRRTLNPSGPTVADSWLAMPWSLRIVRAFLGATFIFAGMQKFLDPGFLHAGGASYIGTQLRGFAQGTPAAPLMHILAKFPVVTGVGVALVEIAVGLATLLGVGLMVAAFIGFTVSVTLWLSATWHIHPYFLGSDSIYAVAWLTLLIGAWESERRRLPGRVPTVAARVDAIDRRALLRGGAVAGSAIVLGMVAKAFAGPFVKGSSALGGTSHTGSQGSSSSSDPVGPPAPAPQGTTIATLSQLPAGAAIGFTDATVGPAALVRLSNGKCVAYSRICTHAGCEVGYNTGSRLLVCPCHGAEFDPARNAEPIAGPASTPLQAIHVVVDEASGTVILPA
jgi:thiosulfate dehydrogenase (quinone) large subunit